MRITIACRCLVGLFGALAFLLASTPLWAQQRSKVEVVAASYHGENGLLSLAFSPNGRFLVSGGLDNTARLWDLETGRLIRRFVGHLDTVSSVGFSPDGRFLLTGSMDNTVKLWEVASGRVVHTLKGRSSGVVSAVLSSDGHFALSGAHINPELTGRADHLTLWDLRKGAKIRTFEGRESTPELVALSPDGRYALSVDREGAFAIWNPLNGRSVRKLGSDMETFNPTSALFTPDSLSAIIASSSGLVRVLNIGSGKESQIALAKNNDGVRNVKLSPDGQRAIVDYESKLELVNVADKRVLQLLAGPSPGHRSPIAFSSDARFAVTSSDNGLTLWNLGTGQEIRRFRNHPSIAPQLVALSPDGQLGLSIAPVNKDYPEGDSTVTVWSNGRLLRRWKAEYVSAVAFSPDNRAFLALGRDGLTWWDAPTGSPIRALRTPFDALSADGHYALSGVAEGEQPKEHKLWDTATGEVVRTFASTTGAAAVSQDGQLALMYGDIDDPLAALILVEVSTGRARHVLKERPEQLRGVAISPDGKHALSVGCDEISFKVCVDSKVRIWDLSKGRLKHALAGHVRGISSATFSGDGKLVLSGGDDGTVRLWETASGRLIHTLAGHTTSIRSVAFDGSAKRALSGSEDGALRMWDLVAGKELAATLMLPQDEWLTITPPGFFSSSARADTELLSIVRGVDVTTIGQLHQSVYSPDLVREAVVGDVNREVERAAQVMSLEKVLDSGPAPQITLASQASESKSDLITIEARITDRGKGIGRIEWRVNGVTVAISGKLAGNGPEYALAQQLALDPGENIIEIVAYNASNLLASLPGRTTITFSGSADTQKPKLHILAIGINAYVDEGWTERGRIRPGFPPLNLAVKDAESFASELKRAAGTLYEVMRPTLVLDKDATRENIDREIARIAKDISPRDTFILFAAAHGTSENGRFYLIPQDYQGGPGALQQRAISQDQVQDWLANRIKARKALILLDTCESGAVVAGHLRSRIEEAASEAGVGRLHEATGRPVLTAAALGQFAREGLITASGERQGFFTHALLNALQNGDTNSNGTIELSELVAYVQDAVPRLAVQNGGTGRVETATPRRQGQTARFGSRGEDFVIANRLP